MSDIRPGISFAREPEDMSDQVDPADDADAGLLQRVRGLLQVQAETRSLDYKQAMTFGPDKRSKGEIVKCIMAFANSRDGGYILVGVEERANGFVPVGLSEEQSRSFDPTALGDFARNYCSVLPRIRSQPVIVDGLTLRLITIDEFESEPIVCTKDLHDDKDRLILRTAAFYVRTEDAKCEEVRSADELRDVLQLAITKLGDVFLRQARAIFGGTLLGKVESSPAPSPYSTEIQDAIDFFVEQGLTGPHWEVFVEPLPYEAERLDRPAIRDARRKAEVSIRGWNFPHIDKEFDGAFDRGVQSVTHFAHFEEAHRLYMSGLFAWRRHLWEDLRDTPEHSGGRKLSFISAINSITEYLTFATRYLTEVVPDGSGLVQVRMLGLRARGLASYEPAFPIWEDYLGVTEEWAKSMEVDVAVLRTDHDSLAIAWAHDLFTRVFDAPIDQAVIRDLQERFLERKF